MFSCSLKKAQQRAFFVLIWVIAVHLFLDFIYRPFQLKRGFFDFAFAFAGSFTQITAIIGIAMIMIIAEFGKRDAVAQSPYFFILVPTVAMIVYELLQIWYSISTFDWIDLFYCVLGALITSPIVLRIVPK